MKATKFIILGIVVVAVSVLATGIVFAHYLAPPATGYAPGPYRDTTDDWGWGRCYERYYPDGYQPAPNSGTTQPPAPLPPQGDYYPPGYYPDSGYYPRSSGRGCWGW